TYTNYSDQSYEYDAPGRLSTVTVTKLNGTTLGASLVTAYDYDSAGDKIRETLPSGEVTTFTFDNLNQLTDVVSKQGSTTVFSQHYTLNLDGARATSNAVQLQSGGGTVTTDTAWGYDPLNRLTSEYVSADGESFTDDYAYDLVGNRLIKAHTGPGGG